MPLTALAPAAGSTAPPFKFAGVKTGNYTLAPWELAHFDATNGSMTATLPANAPAGTQVVVKRIDLANTNPANTNTVSIVPAAGDTIRNGLGTNTSVPLSGQDQSRRVYKESATQWTVLADDPLPSLFPRFSRVMLLQTTVKPGDILDATTIGAGTETAFATQLVIPANYCSAGMELAIEVEGSYGATTAATQTPKVRVGPTSTALLSRATAVNHGALGLLAGTGLGWGGKARLIIQSTGVNGVARCSSDLSFVTLASGQTTDFRAGPTPGMPGNIAIDTTVENTLSLTVTYSSASNGNATSLRGFTVKSSTAPVGSS